MFPLISTKKNPTKPTGLCQGNHFLLPKNDRLLRLREKSLRENVSAAQYMRIHVQLLMRNAFGFTRIDSHFVGSRVY